jgi:hypothetical protein
VFVHGFAAALWVAAAISAIGVVAAFLVPGRARRADAPSAQPLVLATESN